MIYLSRPFAYSLPLLSSLHLSRVHCVQFVDLCLPPAHHTPTSPFVVCSAGQLAMPIATTATGLVTQPTRIKHQVCRGPTPTYGQHPE